MNGIAILKQIAALLVEILILVIFVPKTLYKILSDPSWVARYVQEDTEKRTESADYVAPVLLYILIALVPVVLFPFEKGWDPESAGNILVESLSNIDTLVKGSIYMGIPLSIALVLIIWKERAIPRARLEAYLFTQCYYLSPLLLVVQLRWIFEYLNVKIDDYPLHYLILPLLGLTILWVFVVELFYIHKQLELKLWKSVITIILSFGLIFLITDSIALKVMTGPWLNVADLWGMISVVLISLFFVVALVHSLQTWYRRKEN